MVLNVPFWECGFLVGPLQIAVLLMQFIIMHGFRTLCFFPSVFWPHLFLFVLMTCDEIVLYVTQSMYALPERKIVLHSYLNSNAEANYWNVGSLFNRNLPVFHISWWLWTVKLCRLDPVVSVSADLIHSIACF